MSKKWKVFIAVLSCATILILSALVTLAATPDVFTDEKPQQELHIPTLEEIRQNGYPVNTNGETYGPTLPDENAKEPDLILAVGEGDILGYIKATDTTDNVTSPEEALAYMEWVKKQDCISIPLYMQDGETVIGKFVSEYIPSVYEHQQ